MEDGTQRTPGQIIPVSAAPAPAPHDWAPPADPAGPAAPTAPAPDPAIGPWFGAREPFRPFGRRQGAIVALTVPVAFGSMVFVVCHALILGSAVSRLPAGATTSKVAVPAHFALLLAAALAGWFLQVGGMVGQGFAVGAWTKRANQNARAFGALGMRWAAGWGLGGWFIPYANYVIPLMVLSETWKASAATPYDPWSWRQAPFPRRLGWWWGAWIVSQFGGLAVLMASEFAIILGRLPLMVLVPAVLVSGALQAAACGLFLSVLGELETRQMTAAQRLGLA